MRSLSLVFRLLALPAALTLATHLAHAQTTYTWALTGNASGTWDLTTTNWNPGPTSWVNTTGPANIAEFGSTTGTPSAVNVATGINISELRFTNEVTGTTQTWTFNNNTFTFDGNSTILVAGNQTVRINSVIAGSSGLTVNRTGVNPINANAETRLAGNNTYTGVTTIRRASLAAYHDNALGATGAGNDTLIEQNGRLLIGGLGGTGTAITINEDIRVRSQDANSAEGVAIRSSNANNILNGNVTFVLGSTASTNDRYINVNTNHVFTVNGNITTQVTGTATNPRLAFSATGGAASRVLVNGVISQGTGSEVRLLIDGSSTGANSGIIELAGNNTFTGDITIRRGTLLLSHAGALGPNATAQIFMADGGLGDSTNTLRLLTNGAYTVTRAIQINNPSGNNTAVSIVGGNSAHTSTYSGQISLNSDQNSFRVTAADGGTVNFTGLITDGTGTRGLEKIGNGTVNFSRAAGNTYDGVTTVSAGTLLVNNTSGSATGTGNVIVQSGATLGGNGIISGAVTVNGTLAPGNSPGTLTINNSLVLNASSLLAWEINPTDTTVGGGINDLVTGVTNLTLDGTINFTLVGGPTSISAPGTWRLFNYSGSLTDNTLSIGTLALDAGLTASIDTSTAGQVNLVVIPEPSTWALLAASLGALVIFRRRSRTTS